jgi:hypothetical protein
VSLERCHLENLATHGLLVSDQFPSSGVCPNGFRVNKVRIDGVHVTGMGMIGMARTDLIPQGVQPLAGESGEKLRRMLGPNVPAYAIIFPTLWVREQLGKWLVYDGQIKYPGGIQSTFCAEFETPAAAVEAILDYLGSSTGSTVSRADS